MCDQCEVLAAENEALRAEVKQLRRRIKWLRKRLKAIQEYCERVYVRTQEILNRRSGVWRDKWHVAEGMNRVAAAVLRFTNW